MPSAHTSIIINELLPILEGIVPSDTKSLILSLANNRLTSHSNLHRLQATLKDLLIFNKLTVNQILEAQKQKDRRIAARKLQKAYQLNRKQVHTKILDISNNTGGPATSQDLSSMLHPLSSDLSYNHAAALNALTAHTRIFNSIKVPTTTTIIPPWSNLALSQLCPQLDSFHIVPKGTPTSPLFPMLAYNVYKKC